MGKNLWNLTLDGSSFGLHVRIIWGASQTTDNQARPQTTEIKPLRMGPRNQHF